MKLQTVTHNKSTDWVLQFINIVFLVVMVVLAAKFTWGDVDSTITATASGGWTNPIMSVACWR